MQQVDTEAFFLRKDELAAESVKRVTAIPPVAQAARDGYGKVKMAVVSSGPRAMVETFLEQVLRRVCVCVCVRVCVRVL